MESKTSIMEEFVQLVDDFSQVRAYLQKMSQLSDVPIEPTEQTKLLDACMNVEGVVLAGVPGGTYKLIIIYYCRSYYEVEQLVQTKTKPKKKKTLKNCICIF